jgi:hypothetical protein
VGARRGRRLRKPNEEGLIAALNLERWVKAIKTWEKVDELVERFLDALKINV